MKKRARASSIRLIQRVYWPRIVGLGFSFIGVAPLLLLHQAPLWQWLLLITFSLIWPHIAHIWAMKSKNPLQIEMFNLFFDAFMLGFMVPLMHFSLIPSFAVIGMHLLSIVSVLGIRRAVYGLGVELAGLAVAGLIVGFNIDLETSIPHILSALPMIFVYPLFVAFNAYSLSLKLAAKQSILRTLSRTDGLTQLNNRMYWEELLIDAFKSHRDRNKKASIVFLDVDFFKQVNDYHGHLVGDEVLQNIANLILESVRDSDVCARYGGEEFCILMPDTGKVEAEKLAERLRLHIADSVLHQEHKIKGSVSLGVAEISDQMNDFCDWLDLADKAQYQAKSDGRNCTVVAKFEPSKSFV